MSTSIETVAATRPQAEVPSGDVEALARSFADEIRRLSDGDLTVELEVRDGPMGDLARVFNFAVRALQERMGALEEASGQIMAGARRTRTLAIELSDRAAAHGRVIAEASESAQALRRDLAELDANAQAVAQAAGVTGETVDESKRTAMAVTEGIDQSAGAAHDAAKRMKRLAESAQEMGDLSRVVDELSTQAQVLALNAAIAAERGGEARPQAVVLSEGLERFSEASQEAARDVEALVRRIHRDTGEAVSLLEKTTSSIVASGQTAGGLAQSLDALGSHAQGLAACVEEGRASPAADVLADALLSIGDGARVGGQTAGSVTESVMHLAEFAGVLQATVGSFRITGK